MACNTFIPGYPDFFTSLRTLGVRNPRSSAITSRLPRGRDYFGELKIVDVNVRRLRLKIEDSPTSPTYINTVWGYGYKWGF